MTEFAREWDVPHMRHDRDGNDVYLCPFCGERRSLVLEQRGRYQVQNIRCCGWVWRWGGSGWRIMKRSSPLDQRLMMLVGVCEDE